MLDDHVKQVIQVFARAIQRFIRPAGPARGIKHREIELFVIGVEIGKKIKAFVMCGVRLAVRLINLVDHHNRVQPQRQRL